MAYRNLSESEILGVSLVSGNVPLNQAILNTIYVNELCEVNIPIHKGASKPLERDYIEVHESEEANKIALSYKNTSTSAQHVHAVDGLGDIGLRPSTEKISDVSALDFHKKILSEETDVEIVTLGPLTNIAKLVLDSPELLKNIKHCYIMEVAQMHLEMLQNLQI